MTTPATERSLEAGFGELRRRAPPSYFVLQGNIAALLAAKDHVKVFLYGGAMVPDPEGIITAGRDNTTARTVAVRQGETINARADRHISLHYHVRAELGLTDPPG